MAFSYFDAGVREPERFYHGFVLGLIVSLDADYYIHSNRENGEKLLAMHGISCYNTLIWTLKRMFTTKEEVQKLEEGSVANCTD